MRKYIYRAYITTFKLKKAAFKNKKNFIPIYFKENKKQTRKKIVDRYSGPRARKDNNLPAFTITMIDNYYR